MPLTATVEGNPADVVLENGSCGEVNALSLLQDMVPADWANDRTVSLDAVSFSEVSSTIHLTIQVLVGRCLRYHLLPHEATSI